MAGCVGVMGSHTCVIAMEQPKKPLRAGVFLASNLSGPTEAHRKRHTEATCRCIATTTEAERQNNQCDGWTGKFAHFGTFAEIKRLKLGQGVFAEKCQGAQRAERVYSAATIGGRACVYRCFGIRPVTRWLFPSQCIAKSEKGTERGLGVRVVCLLACLPVNFEALLSVYPSCRATQLEVDSSIPTASPPASTEKELVPSLNFGCSALGYQSDRGGMFLDRSISCSCPLVHPRLDGR